LLLVAHEPLKIASPGSWGRKGIAKNRGGK